MESQQPTATNNAQMHKQNINQINLQHRGPVINKHILVCKLVTENAVLRLQKINVTRFEQKAPHGDTLSV